MQLSEQEIIRREKLQKLRDLGINPYPADLFNITHTIDQLKSDFVEGKKVSIAGRMMSDRDMGKAAFVELQDSEGRFQL
jgi:lysyl-tRNA synthetase class 2